MNSVCRTPRVCAVMLLLAVPDLPTTHASLETSEKHELSGAYKDTFSGIERKAPYRNHGSLNRGSRPRQVRRLSKSSKSHSSEVFSDEDFMKDFEDFYGPLVDVVDSGNRGSKNAKGDKRSGSVSMADFMPLEFSMVFSMGHQPKGSKSSKASKHSKRGNGSYIHDKNAKSGSKAKSLPPGNSDTLHAVSRNKSNVSGEEASPGGSTVTAPLVAVPTSGETSSEVSSAGIVSNQNVEILLPPFTIMFQLTDSGVPDQRQYDELTATTGAFLEQLLKATPGFEELSSIKTEYDASFVWSSGKITVRFHTVVSHNPMTSAPRNYQIEDRIRKAFEGSEQAEYMYRLNDLRDDNAFSSTVDVAFNHQLAVSRQSQDHEDNWSTKRTVAGATLGILLASLTTFSICRRRKRRPTDKLEKSIEADASVCPATVAETIASTLSSLCHDGGCSDSNSDVSPPLSSAHSHTADSSSVYTSGQSSSEEELLSCGPYTTSVGAVASFDYIYTSPTVWFSLNSFERARREDEWESWSKKPVSVQDTHTGHEVESSPYPWQPQTSRTEKIVAADKHEEDIERTKLDSTSSSYRLSLSRDVKRAPKSAGLLLDEQFMANDDLSTVLSIEDNKRQLRMDKAAQKFAQSPPFENPRGPGGVERTPNIDLAEAEMMRRFAQSLLRAGSGTVSNARPSIECCLPDVQQQDDSNQQSINSTRSNVVSCRSVGSITTKQSAKPGRKDLDQNERPFRVPKNMKKAKLRGNAPEFISPWSDATDTQKGKWDVDEQNAVRTSADESSLQSWEDKSDREKAYGLARNMNKLHTDGREPWWLDDEMSMTRRNLLSFKRAHYSRNIEGQADDESVTSRSDTLSRTPDSSVA